MFRVDAGDWRSVLDIYLANRSQATREKYSYVLKLWSEFTNNRALEVSAMHANQFVSEVRKHRGMKGRGATHTELSKNTLRNYVMILKRTYDILITEGAYQSKNPFAALFVEYSNIQIKQRRPIEMVEFDQVLKLINSPGTSKRGIRDRAILALLFGGGLRRSEVCKLSVSSVKRVKADTIIELLETKNGDDANQVLPAWAAEYVLDLLKQRRDEGARDSDPLFCDYHELIGASDKPICVSTIYHMVKFYALKCGLSANISPHSGRATAITKLLDSGMSYREVQEFSRHGSIDMVQQYDKRRYGVADSPSKKLKF